MSLPPIRKIGFIGLGIMGAPMARNLIKAGFEVTVWNRTPEKAIGFPKISESLFALAAGDVDLICINVTNTKDVEELIFGKQGIAAGAAKRKARGLIVVDHSTIDPAGAKEIARKLIRRKIYFLDAPVSGGDIGAQNGTLSIMVGGKAQVFSRALPVLQAMGKTISHLGPSGSGQVCKACNQTVVANNLMGVCEAIALAKWAGLDAKKMAAVVAGGAAQSWQLTNLAPKILAGDYAPGFMVNLARKDLKIVAGAMKRLGLRLHGVSAASKYFKEVIEQGGGNLGTQAMSKAVGAQKRGMKRR